MGQETDNLSLVSLRDYVEALVGGDHAYFDARLCALEKATVTAKDAMERRLEGMNELRAAMKDQASGFISRTEHESTHRALTDDIRSLRESRAEMAGKASQGQVMIAWIMGVVGILLSVISLLQRFFQ
jgi:hypothetical protein